MNNQFQVNYAVLTVSDDQAFSDTIEEIVATLGLEYSHLQTSDISRIQDDYCHFVAIITDAGIETAKAVDESAHCHSLLLSMADDNLSALSEKNWNNCVLLLPVNASRQWLQQNLIALKELYSRSRQYEDEKIQQAKQSQLRGEVLSAIRPALKDAVGSLELAISRVNDELRENFTGLYQLEDQLEWLEKEANELQRPVGSEHM